MADGKYFDFGEELRAVEEKMDLEINGQPQTRVWESITNELVKSYGIRRNPNTGNWDWSLENIATAFKEDPIWTTLDYLALAMAPLKFGLAASSIKKGASAAGAVGKGFQAGEFAGKTAKTFTGKAAAKFVGQELAAATEMKLAGPSRLAGFQLPFSQRTFGFSNPITTQVSDDYIRLVDRYGGEIWENRAIAKSYEREKLIAETMYARKAEDIAKRWQSSGLSMARQGRAMRMLEQGVNPDDNLALRAFRDSPEGLEAYKNTWQFRNSIHEEAYQTGLISEETYRKNLNTYSPRVYEEWEKVRGALAEVSPRATKIPGKFVGGQDGGEGQPATKIVKEGAARFQKRAEKEIEGLTRVFDPTTTLAGLATAGQTIARQKYAQGLAGSVIAKNSGEMADLVSEIVSSGDVKRALLHGVKPEKLDAMRRLVGGLNDVNREVTGEEVAKLLGWKRIDDLYEGGDMPAYVAKLPAELRDKWLDPNAARDIKGTFSALGDDDLFKNFYKKALSTFRASKTAYNPATHVRNLFGASVFHHMATGGAPTFVPRKGLAAFKEQGEVYRAAIEAGIIGSAFDAEIHGRLASAANLKAKTAIDWLPDSFVTEKLKAGAASIEQFYRNTDEVYKLDAWIQNTERYRKAGKDLKTARELALMDVNKFMPNFTMHSELSDKLRQAVPFSSFTTEALRVWKNVLAEKPHLAFFYNHIAHSMSQTFGAMAGFSPDQVDEAQKALPSYMQNRKTLLLPFNVDGRPQFLDLSYLIPMGNIVEAENSERFFMSSLIDPTTNPMLNMVAASATGKDPFSGREIAPNFTERQLGVPVEGKQARRLVGLAEHALALYSPPLMPPGYAGVNLLEAVRGQKNPATNEPLEDGIFRTVLANVTGFRLHSPDVEAQVRNVQEDQRKVSERVSQAWDRWEFARANGNIKTMETERERILAIKRAAGDDDPEEYFAKSIKARDPFAKLSTKQLEEILARAEKLGELSPRDERVRTELLARYQSRKNKTKKDRSSSDVTGARDP